MTYEIRLGRARFVRPLPPGMVGGGGGGGSISFPSGSFTVVVGSGGCGGAGGDGHVGNSIVARSGGQGKP